MTAHGEPPGRCRCPCGADRRPPDRPRCVFREGGTVAAGSPVFAAAQPSQRRAVVSKTRSFWRSGGTAGIFRCPSWRSLSLIQVTARFGFSTLAQCRLGGALLWKSSCAADCGDTDMRDGNDHERSGHRRLGRARRRARALRRGSPGFTARACTADAGRAAGAGRPHGLSRRQMTYHRILRLPPHEADPVQIISAAYVQLRRWRSSELDVSASERQRRVRLIIVARDAMLRHVLDGRTSTRQSRAMLGRLAHSRSLATARDGSPASSDPQTPTEGHGFADGVN